MVLILVVVDNGLVPVNIKLFTNALFGLNPCCSGQWSSTTVGKDGDIRHSGLNPCCSGQWSSTKISVKNGGNLTS